MEDKLLFALALLGACAPGCSSRSQEAQPPQQVLIVGLVTDAEGVGVSGARITFRSDPVEAETDAAGIFTATIDEGVHDFELVADFVGAVHGTIEAAKTTLQSDAGDALGTFVVTVAEGGAELATVCAALNLEDLVESEYGGRWAAGALAGCHGDEIGAQGSSPTELILGNSAMTVNVAADGRLNGFWFPSVGAHDHVPYLSNVLDWVKPYQGSFGGLRIGGAVYWFDDSRYWDRAGAGTAEEWPAAVRYARRTDDPTKEEAAIAEAAYIGKDATAGISVLERMFVLPDANVLVRRFSISGSAGVPARLVYYGRLDVNDNYPMFHMWERDEQNVECTAGGRLVWRMAASPNFAVALEALDPADGSILTMADPCIPHIDSVAVAQAYFPPDLSSLFAPCFPTAVEGSVAEWDVPASNEISIVLAGCEDASETGACATELGAVEWHPYASDEAAVRGYWDRWVGSSTVDARYAGAYERWLVTLKMLADKNTGAIIASPSRQPTYYYSWPRDGTFQAVAQLMSGHVQEAEQFFQYLFEGLELTRDEDLDGDTIRDRWLQAYSSRTGERLGLAHVPVVGGTLGLEQDQMGTVLWGMWVFREVTGRFPVIDNAREQLVEVADYLVDQTCSTGLLRGSLDWQENPCPGGHVGQSLYANAAAVAGLTAAADILRETDAGPEAADRYQRAADTIRDGIRAQLCGDGFCRARITQPVSGACLADGETPTYPDEESEAVNRARLLAFTWPFHALCLGDPLVQDYYRKTQATFAPGEDPRLFIPRRLFSHLYAVEATAPDSELAPDSALRSDLPADVEAFKREFPTGYLFENVPFLRDEKPAPGESGGGSRPLGWSQAMGVLVALAESGTRVPLIGGNLCAAETGRCDPAFPSPAGTWCDPLTGLLWEDPPTGAAATWDEAAVYCDGLSLAGHVPGTWRLPTISEFRSLVRGCDVTAPGGTCGVTDSCLDSACGSMAACWGCDPSGGPGSAGCYWPPELEGNCVWYWSSSPWTTIGGSFAWGVNFTFAGVSAGPTSMANSPRCVYSPPGP